ncbi:MAG: ABC transporter ATP-binding protein [Bacteroidota bacterium]
MALPITLERVSYRYAPNTTPALSDINMVLQSGTCCVILGPTGSGKSTLLHLLAGVLAKHYPESVGEGVLTIGEHRYTPFPEGILFPTVALALQDHYVQISGIRDTTRKEIELTLETLGRDPLRERASIDRLLQQLGIAHLAERKPTALSGGETQRVALATILIANPEIVLLDEPATALDYGAQSRLKLLLQSLRGTSSVVFTDTRIDLPLDVADRFIVLDAGRIHFDGNRRSFLEQLPDFGDLLPVQDWQEAIHEVKGRQDSPLRHRILRAAGLP